MTTDVNHDRLTAGREFFERLDKLERGERAMLKRNAGNTLAEARGVAWFYRLLDGEGWSRPELYFLVATLYGYNARTINGNFGHTMRMLKQKADSDSIERRFRILLDAEFDMVDGKPAGGELAFRLRQLVRLTAAHEVGIDWPQLLMDLCAWSHPNKPVRKAWARSFYAPELPDATDTSNNKGETSHAG